MADSIVYTYLIGLPLIGGIIGFMLCAVAVLVQVFFALGVLQDAETRRAAGQKVMFVKPWVWGGSALFGGALVVAFYWAIHHCALLNGSSQAASPPQP